jgi:hypothetical protein
MATLCRYCDGDRDDFVKPLPKLRTGFNAFISKVGHFSQPHIVITGKYYGQGEFAINYCPMCGKKLIKGERIYE